MKDYEFGNCDHIEYEDGGVSDDVHFDDEEENINKRLEL